MNKNCLARINSLKLTYKHTMQNCVCNRVPCQTMLLSNLFRWLLIRLFLHYDEVIMDLIASQITSLTIVYSTIHSGADQSKHQSSASLAFVWEIHRWPVNFPHKWPVTRKMFKFDDVIMKNRYKWLVGIGAAMYNQNPYWLISVMSENKH